jgi:hypothetical protein
VVTLIVDGGYNLGMPSVRLTIVVRLDQAASLNRLEHFREEFQTLIGTDVSVLLTPYEGPDATELFGNVGHWRFRLKRTPQSATSNTWSPATGTRLALWKRGHLHRRVHRGEPMAP